jgi:hypothetical protein
MMILLFNILCALGGELPVLSPYLLFPTFHLGAAFLRSLSSAIRMLWPLEVLGPPEYPVITEVSTWLL